MHLQSQVNQRFPARHQLVAPQNHQSLHYQQFQQLPRQPKPQLVVLVAVPRHLLQKKRHRQQHLALQPQPRQPLQGQVGQ
ncbi:MAG: hypothetical protein ACFFDY_01330 [Candidatus Thorarchaeota archaeon]